MGATPEFIPAFLIAYSDASFTNPHEVVLPDEPKDCTGDFTHMGVKYWGLETKRHKATRLIEGKDALAFDHDAHHWFSVGFKQRAEISELAISTKWFTGNQVPALSVFLIDALTGKEVQVLDREALNPDAEHRFPIPPTIATECRVEAYHEGGVSRVNAFGTPTQEQLPQRNNLLETAAISHVSNEHYGKPQDAVAGNRGVMHMVGWESARSGFGEQALFHLQKPAILDEIVIDTYLHRLNPPLSAHVFGINTDDVEAAMAQAPRYQITFENGKTVMPEDFPTYMREAHYLKEDAPHPRRFTIHVALPEGSPWQPILPFAPLQADTYHRFKELKSHSPVTHILYMHYPHGGIHGLKMFGTETG